jgi:glucose-6-phosphate 1-dehydrogenase
MVKRPGDELAGDEVELLVSHDEDSFEADAYEQLLGDAMDGEPFRFAREDYVEEAWRIVDGIAGVAEKPVEYEPGSWGPKEAERLVQPGTWHDPQGAR